MVAEILKLRTHEIVIGEDFNQNVFLDLKNLISITYSIENNTILPSYLKGLVEDLDISEEKNFSRLLNYIIRTQKKTLVHMQKVNKYDSSAFMRIDLASRRNLELIETLRFQNRKHSLFNTMDRCTTAMGSRFLKKQLIFPLIEQDKIENRYDIIDKLKKNFLETADLKKALESVYDLERIVGKIAYESANPKDLLQLKKSLSVIPRMKTLLTKIKINSYFDLETDFEAYQKLHQLLTKAISIDAPFTIKEGGIINEGYSQELDDLRNINNESKDYLLDLELRERERTGIKNLKVGYNRVFGYFIEVSKGNKDLVKDEYGYIRRH